MNNQREPEVKTHPLNTEIKLFLLAMVGTPAVVVGLGLCKMALGL